MSNRIKEKIGLQIATDESTDVRTERFFETVTAVIEGFEQNSLSEDLKS